MMQVSSLVVALAAAAFFTGAVFFAVVAVFFARGAEVFGTAADSRRGRPAAAVASYSFPLLLVTVAGASMIVAAALAGVAFALVPFLGGIVAMAVVFLMSLRRCFGREKRKLLW